MEITNTTLVQAIRNGELEYRGLWKDFEDKDAWHLNEFVYLKDQNKYVDQYDTIRGLQTWELDILDNKKGDKMEKDKQKYLQYLSSAPIDEIFDLINTYADESDVTLRVYKMSELELLITDCYNGSVKEFLEENKNNDNFDVKHKYVTISDKTGVAESSDDLFDLIDLNKLLEYMVNDYDIG